MRMHSQPHFLVTILLSLGMTYLSAHAGANEYKVTPLTIPDRFELDGRVEAVHAGTLSAQTSGTILSVSGDVGDQVSKGQLLIQIDDTQQKAAVAQAEAALAQADALNDDAQTLLQRNTRLHKQGTLSESELDRTQAQAKSAAANTEAAKAALIQARAQLSYTRITAPYAGVIMERFVEVGELVNVAQPLISGYGTNKMRVITHLPQRIANQYSSSSQVSLLIDNAEIQATDATLYPFADDRYHSVQLRADLPEAQSHVVIPGQWLKVKVTTGNREVIAVPEQAILRRGEISSVYVKQAERPALLRQIRLGNAFTQDNVNWVEVLAGLSTGEYIHQNALATRGNRGKAASDATPDKQSDQ